MKILYRGFIVNWIDKNICPVCGHSTKLIKNKTCSKCSYYKCLNCEFVSKFNKLYKESNG